MIIIYIFFFLTFLLSDVLTDSTRTFVDIKLNTIDLTEDEYFLGNVSDMLILDDQIILADRQQSAILKFNREGELITFLINEGRGPLEFLNPTNLSLYHDWIYVWDATNLKLVSLELENLKPHSEWNMLSEQAVEEIAIKEDILFVYSRGGFYGAIIKAIDLQTQQVIGQFGEKSEEQILLMTMRGQGGMEIIDQNRILYVTPDLTRFHIANINDLKHEYIDFHVSGFHVLHVDNAHHIINYRRDEILDWLGKSGSVTNVYELSDFYVAEVHTGEISIETSGSSDPFHNRLFSLVIFDKEFNLIERKVLEDPRYFTSHVRAKNNNSIFVFHYTNMNDEGYSITEIALNRH